MGLNSYTNRFPCKNVQLLRRANLYPKSDTRTLYMYVDNFKQMNFPCNKKSFLVENASVNLSNSIFQILIEDKTQYWLHLLTLYSIGYFRS